MSTPQIDPLAEYAASFIAQLKLEGKDINEIIGILEADGAPQESDADAGEKESEADKAAVKKSNNIKTDTIGESEAHAGVKRKRSEAAADVEKPKTIITLPEIISSNLSNINSPIPESLLDNDKSFAFLPWKLTAKQADLVVLLLETRHWIFEVKEQSRHYRHWARIFSISRQEHREARGLSITRNDDLERILQNRNASRRHPARNEWIRTLVVGKKQFLPPYITDPPAYKILKKKHFPSGDIDDAMPGFLSHTHILLNAMHELMLRYVRLADLGVFRKLNRDFTLETTAYNLLSDTKEMMKPVREHVDEWFVDTCETLRIAQLPGAQYAMPFGADVLPAPDDIKDSDISDDEPEHEDGQDDDENDEDAAQQDERSFVRRDPRYSPIRLRHNLVGSAWCDWFRNDRGERPYTTRSYTETSVSGGPRPGGDRWTRRRPRPVRINLPQKMESILDEISTVLAAANGEVNANPQGRIPPPPSSDPEEFRNDEISRRLREHYWRARRYRTVTSTITINMDRLPFLKYRPIYDGAGNLRLDYMNAMLRELATGETHGDYCSYFDVVSLRTRCRTRGPLADGEYDDLNENKNNNKNNKNNDNDNDDKGNDGDDEGEDAGDDNREEEADYYEGYHEALEDELMGASALNEKLLRY